MQQLKQLSFKDTEKARIKLYLLEPKERYALMEKRILANRCPNCDVPLNRVHTKLFKCAWCGFVSDGI